MAENLFATVALSSWADFKKFTDELSPNWAFRGQLSADWELRNAIERTDFIRLYEGIEADFVSEFQRGARKYLSRDEIPEHLIEWLALMQHHGAPTRLLDFTWSPFIASFFAFEACHITDSNNITIWAINIKFLKQKAIEILATHFPREFEESANLVNEKLFEKIFYANKYSLVFPVEPFRMNRRYSLQQSVFVSTGNALEPFVQQLHFLKERSREAVIKIEMPAVLQKEVLRDLQRMNLNRASLFPDLDGYAAALRLRYNSMKTPEESMLYQLQKLEDRDFDFIP